MNPTPPEGEIKKKNKNKVTLLPEEIGAFCSESGVEECGGGILRDASE